MIEVKRLLKALRDDLCATAPVGERARLRSLLNHYRCDNLLEHLQSMQELEHAVTHEKYNFSSTTLGSILFYARFTKKMPLAGSASSDAVASFVERQDRLVAPSWYESHLDAIQRWCKVILRRFDPDECKFRHGPGLVAEGRLGLDKTAVSFPLALNAIQEKLSFDPLRRITHTVAPVVSATRITTVPKDWRGDRVIGMEPVWNMVIQQGLKAALMTCSGTWIPYHNQDIQRRKLLSGRLGRCATVDLSNASDHVTVELARDVLPPDIFNLLEESRTPWYTVNGELSETRSFALMGNGFCFPCLSVITLSLVCAALGLTLGIKPSVSALKLFTQEYSVGVFGDDIVVPKIAQYALETMLAEAGLVVNHSKTFFDGPFRETCGLYHFSGSSPFECYYLKHLEWDCESWPNLCSLQNRLEDSGFVKTAAVIGASAPEWVPRANRRLALPIGSALRADDTNLKWSKRRFGFSLRSPFPSQRTREVHLCDESGWFAAFHGGIPVREVVV